MIRSVLTAPTILARRYCRLSLPHLRKEGLLCHRRHSPRRRNALRRAEGGAQKSAYAAVGWVERNAPIAPAGFNDPLSVAAMGAGQAGGRRPLDRRPADRPRPSSAIVDSGLRRPDGGVHADLAGRVEPLAVCQPPGFFTNGIDRVGHGTFLAGTIAAVPDNDTGDRLGRSPPLEHQPASGAVLQPRRAAQCRRCGHRHRPPPLSLQSGAKVINASWHVAPGDRVWTALGTRWCSPRRSIVSSSSPPATMAPTTRSTRSIPRTSAVIRLLAGNVLTVAGERPLRRQGVFLQLRKEHRPYRRARHAHPDDGALSRATRRAMPNTAAPRPRRPTSRRARRSSSRSIRAGRPRT